MKRFLILAIAVLVIAMTLASCELPGFPSFNPTTPTTPTTPTNPTTTTTTPEPDPDPECDHVYDNACDAACNECGATREVGDHVYDNACDTSCNVCGAERTTAHVYDNACDDSCNECGATREVGDHVYDNACDATCNICQETREVGDHVYTNTCDTDCNECGATREITHTYDNACDTTCNVCGGGERTTEHQYEEEVTAPTCFAAGYTTHTCKECSYSYQDNETAQLTHVDENDDEMCDHGCGTEMLKPRYTVTLNYGSKTKTIDNVKEGTKLTADDLALDSKYPFAVLEWQKDGVAYDLDTAVMGDMTLTAALANEAIYDDFEAAGTWNLTKDVVTYTHITEGAIAGEQSLQFTTTAWNGIYRQNLTDKIDFSDVNYIYLKIRTSSNISFRVRFFATNTCNTGAFLQHSQTIDADGLWHVVCIDLNNLSVSSGETFAKELIKSMVFMSSDAATIDIDDIIFARDEVVIEEPKPEEPEDKSILTYDFDTKDGWYFSGSATAMTFGTDSVGNTVISGSIASYGAVYTKINGAADLSGLNYIYVKVKTTTQLQLRVYAGDNMSSSSRRSFAGTVVGTTSDGYSIVRFDLTTWDSVAPTGAAFDKAGIYMFALVRNASGTATYDIDKVVLSAEEISFE